MDVKIKLLVSRVGPTVNDVAGDEIFVSEDTARAMCELSSPPQAIRVGVEKAVPPAPQTTTKPKATKTTKPAPEKAVK